MQENKLIIPNYTPHYETISEEKVQIISTLFTSSITSCFTDGDYIDLFNIILRVYDRLKANEGEIKNEL